MPDASPAKWHRGHTTWFFETIVLKAHAPAYRSFHERYNFIFNSYYESLGPRHARNERGLLSRPSCAEVTAYRRYVDDAILHFIETTPAVALTNAGPLLVLGLNHEQQHQELLLTDILHAFSKNPFLPAYLPRRFDTPRHAWQPTWVEFAGSDYYVGHTGASFAFDNEGPHHRLALPSFAISSRPVSNKEWISFVDDGGYARPEFWLSDGWAAAQSYGWNAPLYWTKSPEGWTRFSLHGPGPLDLHAPVANISFYEADAFARWSGCRLPSEAEWEVAAQGVEVAGNLADDGLLEPTAAAQCALAQMYGDVWEWTCSPYVPYPGFRPNGGVASEYNGKFMVNQVVLKGGSCLTPASHIRPTYRNFFYPSARWQFAGLRLAKDL